MASVTLQGLWIHDADDLSNHVQFDSLRRNTVTPERTVEARERAGGRIVMISRPTRRRTGAFAVRTLDDDRVGWLEDHAGELVMVRDYRGEKIFGFYPEVQVEPLDAASMVDVSFTVQLITFSEEV